MGKSIEVVVVGGGYAGVMAANRVRQRDDVTVTVINPRQVFVPRLRLHQLVGGTHDAVVDYQEVLSEGVELVIGNATHIDATARTVSLAEGGSIGYDYLIYAVGSFSGTQVPGAAEFAYPVATLEAAQRLRSVLSDTPSTATVTVRLVSRPLPNSRNRVAVSGWSAAVSSARTCTPALGAQPASTSPNWASR
jgi:NADH dehydrogenase